MVSTPSDKLVTVFGGSGFIGRQIVRSLAKRGYRIRVACRRPDLAGHVLPLGTPGQIALVQANLRYPASVAAACEGAYAVINATGTDVSSGAQSFDAVVVFGSEAVAKAARQAKASLMLMVSGMAADAESPSLASQAKAKAEAATARAFPGAMVVRPSVVFGPDDRFFNRMAGLVRFAPVLPVIAPETKVQPVFVGDVAEAMATLVDRGVADGKTYELGGPATGTLQDMMQYVVDVTQRKRLLLPLPHGAAKLFGLLIGWLPGAPINADQVEMLQGNNVVSAAAHAEGRDLAGLGITPRAFATIVPTYLYRFRKEGQFTVPN
ncbi:MAG: complex I NDUFA9 subunit family protein [Rhizobiales bacterium]|nr:complex I NDUFA9 subunit family protein [Hyphomicrobiales bacterium]